MKPLIVLLVAFLVSLIAIRFITGTWSMLPAGNIAMSLMLVFTSIGHFKFPEGMALMLPDFVPERPKIVLITGLLELLFAWGLLIPSTRHFTGIALILFLILVLPANIYAAANNIDYQRANNAGPGISYLWFRIPLQAFFIAWVWYFALGGSQSLSQ